MRGEGSRDILPTGYTLHWYELLEVLGRGGYGVTYLAFDRNLHRKVAIKEYLPLDFACRENNDTVHPITNNHNELYNWGLQRFLVEARTLAKFNHRSIIRVLSVFEHNNTAYMVMEYEEGSDLSAVYHEKKASTETELLPIFIPIIEGLSMVHEEGFIHRDIKPSNIYVRADSSSVLLDFGSARQTLGNRTRALTSLITAGYAPFEQYNESEDEQGAWTDIYGLGSTLYFCVTGDKPADALKRGATLIKQGYDIYKPVSHLAPPGFSAHFLAAIDLALMFHAEARPQTALQWADMLIGEVDVPPLPEKLYTAPATESAQELESNAVLGNRENISQRIAPSSRAGPVEIIPVASSVENDDSTRVQPRHSAPSVNPLNSLADKTAVSPLSSKPLLSKKRPTPQAWVAARYNDVVSAFAKITNHQHGKAVLAGMFGLPLIGVVIAILIASSSDPVLQSDIALQNLPPAEAVSEQTEMDPQPLESPANDQFQTTENTPTDNNSPEQNIAQAKQALIDGLLQQARLDIEADRYLEPAENNALFQYRKILALEPGHAEAQAGITDIVEHYAQRVEADIESEQWEQAQAQFAKLKSISAEADSVEAESVKRLQSRFDQHNALQQKINRSLAQADRYLRANKLTRPKSKNALTSYNQVLALDAENAAALAGLDKIVQKLSGFIKKQLKAGQISRAEATFEKIEQINPDAPVLAEVESQLSAIIAKRKKIKKLLQIAERDFIRGRLIKPKGENALARYRKVLKLSPKHKQATSGVERVYDYYLSQFNQHVDSQEFGKARKVINTLSSVGYGKKRAGRLKARIEDEKLAIKNEPQQISDLLQELKAGLESRDFKKIETISYFNQGKKKLVKDLFDNYSEFTVKVLKTSHDIKLHKASARIQLENMVDHWEDKIEKSDWLSVDVQVNKNENKQWRVYW